MDADTEPRPFEIDLGEQLSELASELTSRSDELRNLGVRDQDHLDTLLEAINISGIEVHQTKERTYYEMSDQIFALVGTSGYGAMQRINVANSEYPIRFAYDLNQIMRIVFDSIAEVIIREDKTCQIDNDSTLLLFRGTDGAFGDQGEQ